RIVADALIHYLNVVGAYLVCLAAIAVALYLSTAFSFGAIQVWSKTRLSFAYAAVDRFADWRAERARRRAARDLEKKRAAAANAKPVVTAQLVPRRAAEQPTPAPVPEEVIPPPLPVAAPARAESVRSGIDREFETAAPIPRSSADPKRIAPPEPEASPAGESIAVGS